MFIIFIIINFLISKFTLFAFCIFQQKVLFYLHDLFICFIYKQFQSFSFFFYVIAISSTQLKEFKVFVVLFDERKKDNRMKCLFNPWFCFVICMNVCFCPNNFRRSNFAISKQAKYLTFFFCLIIIILN